MGKLGLEELGSLYNFASVMRILVAFITILCNLMLWPIAISARQTEIDSLLNQLDLAISNRVEKIVQKEHRIDSLRNAWQKSLDDHSRFHFLGELYREFLTYNTDSAYTMSMRQEALARSMNDNPLLWNAQLNKANILNQTGMYHESISVADSVPYEELPEYLRPYYFHTYRTIYGNLADYAKFAPDKRTYQQQTERFRDSLLTVNRPPSIFYYLIKADQLNVNGNPKAAVKMLNEFIEKNPLSEHENAMMAFTLSNSYGLIGDSANQKKQLLISAIADMNSAVLEYVSLRQLALMLYKEGDLDRAYRYLNLAMEDAAKCNARQRIVELNESYPMVTGIYVNKVRQQKQRLAFTVMLITLMALVLIAMLIFSRKQTHKIREEREKVDEANRQLKLSNEKLTRAYDSLTENSALKEVYISQYMTRSLAYIEALDSYRKMIGKMWKNGKTQEFEKQLKNTDYIDKELKSFYDEFDKTFLSIFPTFVEDFNALLRPDEAIIPKKEGSLNTELRIYALIRLGITDSNKIALFLRYSLTTIYNYRTRTRNKALGDRNQLEKLVMELK